MNRKKTRDRAAYLASLDEQIAVEVLADLEREYGPMRVTLRDLGLDDSGRIERSDRT